jgi:DNA-binding transcriptional MerR regulator
MTRDVAQRLPVTPRQLQWWDDSGLLRPKRLDNKRLYRYDEVIKLLIVAELRHKGWALVRISSVLRPFTGYLNQARKHPERNYRLVTDGKSIALESDDNRIIAILKGARSGMAIVSLTDQMVLLERAFRFAPR